MEAGQTLSDAVCTDTQHTEVVACRKLTAVSRRKERPVFEQMKRLKERSSHEQVSVPGFLFLKTKLVPLNQE